MSRYVIDTSVVIAWYLPEAFSSSARGWQRRCLDSAITLLTPAFHYWEVGNVLRSYVRRGELDSKLAAEIYDLHLQAPLETAEPNRSNVFQRALDYDATIYDAVFIELALEQDVPLITAEKSTTPWVVKLRDRAVLVR